LRTPLTVVRGFIGILMRGNLRAANDFEHIVNAMNRQCVLMGSLIDKLMLLDVWDEADRAEPPPAIDLSQLVEDIVGPLADASPGREVTIDAEPGALARIDPMLFSHAVTNLVDNALKYAPASAVRVTLAGDRTSVRIVVADDGPGLSEDEAQHVFDRFYRSPLRRAVPGSGLGLPIARRAVERGGGTLTLESAPGRGARFTIRLPRATPAATGAVREPAQVSA
jgi:two-component system OmpR family sensor kinase